MINLSNINDNGNNVWANEVTNDFKVGNQNYTNMLDLTNQISSKRILKIHEDDTLNDRDVAMASFHNSIDKINFSGNYSNRNKGVLNISGFLNMTNN